MSYPGPVLRLSPNALGSLYMVIGSLGYVVNDGIVRRTTENDIGVYQVLCLRSVVLASFLAILGRLRHEHTTRAHLHGPLLVRVGAEVGAAALFFAALLHLEFANAQAIVQIVPFVVTLAAAWLLGERVTVRQYLAVLMGFVGVLVIVRPATDGFSVWSVVVLASAALLVVREFATRQIDADVPAVSIAFVTAAGLALLTGALSFSEGWDRVTFDSGVLIMVASGFLVIGYLFTIQTVRVGDLSVSAPFRYSVLLGAIAVGLVLFSEVPDLATVVGMVVIVVSGVYAVVLERQRVTATQ